LADKSAKDRMMLDEGWDGALSVRGRTAGRT
jgi:hypothetical protein